MDNAIDLLALFAEVNADRAANPAKFAAIEAAYDKAPGGKCYIAPLPCGKCNGTGHLVHYKHIANGDCFDCDGTGKA